MSLRVIVCFALCLMSVQVHAGFDRERRADDVGSGEHTSFEEKQENSVNKWVDFSGSLAFVSDYISRGQTQTFGGPAVQGGFTLSQKKDEGVYAGVWGSNIDSIATAPNGAGLEFDLYGGYIHKCNNDLSIMLELYDTRYPGARASLPLKDKFDYLEIIPGFKYKFLYVFFAYSISDRSGLNQNFAPTFPIPLKPNGNSKGSWYAEASAKIPLSFISDNLKLRLLYGYRYARNYTVLNYAVFSVGLKYLLPEDLGGVSIFINLSATTANKKYYKTTNPATGEVRNTVAPKVWLGIAKKF